MLQQTQVASVIPYFERFLKAFPTLDALAAADEQSVLRQWEGLGYYRRARDLHRAARIIVADHGGRIPEDPDALRQLPGFGRYTANAVLSQAFDQRLPILEANSRRVLCRLLGVQGNPHQAAVQAQLWQAAGKLVPAKRPGAFNQALMELGALVCTTRDPQCWRCPLARGCIAHRAGAEDRIPVRAKRLHSVHVHEVAVVVQRRGRLLLVRRPDRGRWAGLWEFPHIEQEALESAETAGQRLLAALGMQGRVEGELATIRHAVTRFHIRLICLSVVWQKGMVTADLYPDTRWVAPSALAELPVSSPQRRLAHRWLTSTRA